MLISLSNVSNLLQNGHLPILVANFLTISTVKVELLPDFYTWAIVLINTEEICEKQFLFFAS